MSERYKLQLEPFALPDYARRIQGGETGAALYRCDSRVVKRTEGGAGLEEIANNITGYRGISDAGGSRILPEGIEWHIDDMNGWIVMPDLGSDMSVRDLAGDRVDTAYSVLMREILKMVTESAKDSSDEQVAGLRVLTAQLKAWLKKINEMTPGLFSSDLPGMLDELDLEKSASRTSSVMIQDFTPDNIFVNGERAAFIDPWHQQTYRGTFIPSLAQYRANAVEIREFPSAVSANDAMLATLKQIACVLHLTDEQLSAQKLLGEALQYSLSAYVRLEREPGRAAKYVGIAEYKINNLHEMLGK